MKLGDICREEQLGAPDNRLGDKGNEQLEPYKEPFLKQPPCLKEAQETGRRLYRTIAAGTLQRTCSQAPAICLGRWYESGRHIYLISIYRYEEKNSWESSKEPALTQPFASENGMQLGDTCIQRKTIGGTGEPSKETFL